MSDSIAIVPREDESSFSGDFVKSEKLNYAFSDDFVKSEKLIYDQYNRESKSIELMNFEKIDEQFNVMMHDIRYNHREQLSSRAKKRRDNKCCILINDRQSRTLGMLPISLLHGTYAWMTILMIFAFGSLQNSLETIQVDFWKAMTRCIFFIVVLSISFVGFLTLVQKRVDGMYLIASLNLVIFCFLTVIDLAQLIQLIYLSATQYTNPSNQTPWASIMVRLIWSPILLGIFLGMTSTIKSLACVWDVGGTGAEYVAWNSVWEIKRLGTNKFNKWIYDDGIGAIDTKGTSRFSWLKFQKEVSPPISANESDKSIHNDSPGLPSEDSMDPAN